MIEIVEVEFMVSHITKKRWEKLEKFKTFTIAMIMSQGMSWMWKGDWPRELLRLCH